MTDTLLERAGALLAVNTQSATHDGLPYVFTVPSVRAYPFQWFWDSCFHAIVWSQLDVERAKDELRSLLVNQRADGLVPHVVFWDERRVSRLTWHHLESAGRLDWITGRPPRVSAHMQPPVLALAVEEIAKVDGDAFVGETLPALERYYRHLCAARDPDRDALISIIAQFESGIDFSPAYDVPRDTPPAAASLAFHARAPEVLNKLLGYDLGLVFRLNRRHTEDVLVNAIHADGLRTLARLAARVGAAELESWAGKQAARTRDALLERCYDERRGLFYNVVGARERPANRATTIISLLPLLLEDLPPEVVDRLVEHLSDPRQFAAAFPVPSVALDDPAFLRTSRLGGHRLIWRGPSSMNTNWLLVRGLRRHDRHEVADRIAERSRELVDRGGFNEFFDPIDGTPVGAADFGWATLGAVMQLA